jgi:DNA-binding transcriptional ArsR family regulator
MLEQREVRGSDDLGPVFRALADPTRRRILDLLRMGPMTTGQVSGACPDVTRFAVMKHLTVLEEAELVVVRRRGRERWNYLNAVPIRQVYERWISPFEGVWAESLLRLKAGAEANEEEGERHGAGNGKHRARRAGGGRRG